MSVELAGGFGEAGVRWRAIRSDGRRSSLASGVPAWRIWSSSRWWRSWKRCSSPASIAAWVSSSNCFELLLVAGVERLAGILRAVEQVGDLRLHDDRYASDQAGHRLGRLQIHNDGANPQVSCFS
jgi:hypothetical protein